MDNLWSRRTNSSKLSLSTPGAGQNDSSSPNTFSTSGRNASYPRRLGGDSSAHGSSKPGGAPFSSAITPAVGGLMSPGGGGGASTAFGLGQGAFASFGSAKTPKSPGNPFDFALGKAAPAAAAATADKGVKDGAAAAGSVGGGIASNKTTPATATAPTFSPATAKIPSGAAAVAATTTTTTTTTTTMAGTGAGATASSAPQHTLRTPWVFWFRPPISKANGYIEYEKTLHAMAEVASAEEFFAVYSHLKRPSELPLVSDYHLFRKGVRPIWEDEENRKGGKWIVRLKKGVADHYWEDLLLAIIGDQFQDAGEEVCGAVLSVRNGEDILSVWVRRDGGKVVKIRETMKRLLSFRPDTKVEWKSHEGSIQQRSAIDDMRRERAAAGHPEKRSIKHGSGGGGPQFTSAAAASLEEQKLREASGGTGTS